MYDLLADGLKPIRTVRVMMLGAKRVVLAPTTKALLILDQRMDPRPIRTIELILAGLLTARAR